MNVISKSGTTTEPAIAFRIFKDLLEEKYGVEGAKKRIYATTDAKRGALKEMATSEGYTTFVIPNDVGGRFSVLTPVGLLPMAVCGIDLDQIMAGAARHGTVQNPNLGKILPTSTLRCGTSSTEKEKTSKYWSSMNRPCSIFAVVETAFRRK